jgi:hypothetical protein
VREPGRFEYKGAANHIAPCMPHFYTEHRQCIPWCGLRSNSISRTVAETASTGLQGYGRKAELIDNCLDAWGLGAVVVE